MKSFWLSLHVYLQKYNERLYLKKGIITVNAVKRTLMDKISTNSKCWRNEQSLFIILRHIVWLECETERGCKIEMCIISVVIFKMFNLFQINYFWSSCGLYTRLYIHIYKDLFLTRTDYFLQTLFIFTEFTIVFAVTTRPTLFKSVCF